MPVIETKGALSSQGFGEFAKKAGAPVYIEDVFQTWLYTGNDYLQTISNGLPLGDVQTSLVGKTLTNLGGNFDPSYPMSNINDGIVETTNAANVGFVPTANGFFDVYVDMGSSTIVTGYLFAPQGDINNAVYNTPTAFNVKASNDASTWSTIATFTSISVNTPNWNAGSYRPFVFANSTGYRYWRFENTTKGSASAGVAISEWQLLVGSTPASKGGMVWIAADGANRIITDTIRGAGASPTDNNALASSLSSGQDLGGTAYDYVSAFNSTGFSVAKGGTGFSTWTANNSATNYVSWTFVKQPKFFDIVTYSGNGSNRTIAHNLGSVPGCMMVKRTDTTEDWQVYHRSLANTEYMVLNGNGAKATGTTRWNSTTPTATEFSVGTDATVNANGGNYVAYLFAHDAGGFGLAGTDNVITCGSYTGNGSATGPTVTLGYEPQWVLIKGVNANSWFVIDNMRGMANSTNGDVRTTINNGGTNIADTILDLSATGFQIVTASTNFNTNFVVYVYIAIRNGPMKVPTSGTSIYNAATFNSGNSFTTAGFPVDFILSKQTTAPNDWRALDRLRGNPPSSLYPNSTAAESSEGYWRLDNNTGVNMVSFPANNYQNWMFQRAPGFFDVVCYAGTSGTRTVTHNLGVVPELIIIKSRTTSASWAVYAASLGNNKEVLLNTTNASFSTSDWNNTTPTSTVFTLAAGGGATNDSGVNYVAYLFATCAGVSKVGSYTGTGNTLQIDCGFTGGARFVLIKRTDSTGDWYLWDSTRGIVSGNDPYLTLNSTAAEVTTTDWVDTHNPGFELSNAAGNNVNINTATYIFLAIA